MCVMSALVVDGDVPTTLAAARTGTGSHLITTSAGHTEYSDGCSNTKSGTSSDSAGPGAQKTATVTAQRENGKNSYFSSCEVVTNQEVCQSPRNTGAASPRNIGTALEQVSWQPSSPPANPTTSKWIAVKHTADTIGQGEEGGNVLRKSAGTPLPAPVSSGNTNDLLNDFSADLDAAMERIAAVQNAKLNHLHLSGLITEQQQQQQASTSATQSEGKTIVQEAHGIGVTHQEVNCMAVLSL